MRRRFHALILLALVGGCAPLPPLPAAEPPARVWEPAGPARAQIVALHGFGDHKGGFDGLGRWLAERGYRLLAYDQPGFGEQPDRLFWAGTEALVVQARAVVARERARRPDLPVFLLGESMGGAVALLAASGSEAVPVDGLALVAPAVWGGDGLPALYRAATRALAALLPWFRLSGRGLPVHPADDPAVTRALARDPLYTGEPRAHAVAGLLALMDEAAAAGPALAVPTLLLVPGRDDIVPTRVQLAFAATIEAADCTLLLYPEARHLMLRDRGRERVWQDLLAWLERAAPPSGLGRPCRAANGTSPRAMVGPSDRRSASTGSDVPLPPLAAGLDPPMAPVPAPRRPERCHPADRPTRR